MCMSAWSLYVWAECEESSSVTTVLLTDGLAQALLGGSLLWEAWGSPNWDQEPRRARLSSFCVYVNGLCLCSDSVWQGVVGGCCSTAIIWAQEWRVIEEVCWGVGGGGVGGGGVGPLGLFHLDISQILPVCIWATVMNTFLEMVHLYILALVHLFVCIHMHFNMSVCLCVYILPLWLVRGNRRV